VEQNPGQGQEPEAVQVQQWLGQWLRVSEGAELEGAGSGGIDIGRSGLRGSGGGGVRGMDGMGRAGRSVCRPVRAPRRQVRVAE
jgi:hypothetical protein